MGSSSNTAELIILNSDTRQAAKKALQQYWGYPDFRKGQAEAIEALLSGRDTFVLFPTGGGKSLCFQVPALLLDGLTLVISPLVALMQDQVDQLKQRNITAACINSSISRKAIEQTLLNARNGMYKLLYCSPERLQTSLFQDYAGELNLEMIAVDEAHCISEWGHDFRPAYRQIRESMEQISPDLKWIALTATATPRVRDDIVQSLSFSDPEIVVLPFRRENLHWWVAESVQKRKLLLKSAQRGLKLGSGLIYCNTRRECDELVNPLSELGIKSAAYHAGLTSDDRKSIQQAWIENEIPLVMCTSAFGMGIDKPDCRFVIHKAHPYSLEAYYQEAGRAGRDGEAAFPMLLYRESDYLKARKNLDENYPAKDEIRKVYDALCDELGLAVGEQSDDFMNLDAEKIKKRAGLNMRKVRASLRLLQQFDVIEIQSRHQAFLQLQFLLSPEAVKNEFRSAGENRKSEFTDQLIRIAGQNVFQEEIEIPVEILLDKMKISLNSLLKGLEVLSRHDKILNYAYQSESERIKVLQSRSRTLPVDFKLMQQYRVTLSDKLEKMHQYTQTRGCREVFLRTYFGDMDAEDCERCDNCLQKNRRETAYDPVQLQQLKSLLKSESRSIPEMIRELNTSKKGLIRMLDHLQRENKISRVDEEGERYQWVR